MEKLFGAPPLRKNFLLSIKRSEKIKRLLSWESKKCDHGDEGFHVKRSPTSIKYKVERDERYLPYIELGAGFAATFSWKLR